MVKMFDRNMFIMMISIMVGVLIITFFIADLQRKGEIEELERVHSTEIKVLEEKNIDFTSSFLSSIGDLDRAREFRASGNYFFELGSIWYVSAWSENNASKMEVYKSWTIDNCSNAIIKFQHSYGNFVVANINFEKGKSLTSYQGYIDLIDLYMNLSLSGANLSSLRMQASNYLIYLAENVTFVEGEVAFIPDSNMSEILDLYNQTLEFYGNELEYYKGIEDEIEKEYDIIGFSEDREAF